MSDPAPISVIIPTCRSRLVKEMLRGLADAAPPPAQVIVVDDASRPPVAHASADLPGVEVVRLDQRAGPAAARNRGAERATQEVLVFLDDDVLVRNDTFARMLAHLADPSVSAVTGLFSRQSFFVNFCSVYKNEYMHYICRRAEARTSTLLTAVCAVRRSALQAAGGFDESIRCATVEDIDLGRRLSAAGPAVRFDPELQVMHLKHYGPLTLVRSHFQRSLDMARYLMRRGRLALAGEILASQERLSLPWHFAAGVVLAALFLLSPVLYCLAPARWAAWGQVFPFLLVGLVNLPFLAFLARGQGTVFALRAWPVLFGEFAVSAIAVCCAALVRGARRSA